MKFNQTTLKKTIILRIKQVVNNLNLEVKADIHQIRQEGQLKEDSFKIAFITRKCIYGRLTLVLGYRGMKEKLKLTHHKIMHKSEIL